MPYQFSDALDDELTYERCESFGGGMDAFTTPSLLPADAWQYGENLFVPDNLRARTRAGADNLGASPANPAAAIQGLIYFDTNAVKQLMAASSAKLWLWTGAAPWTQAAGWVLNDAGVLLTAAQGIDKLLLSDGIQHLRTWDGAAFVDCGNTTNSTNGDPPVGATILCWHTGRMFAAGVATANDTLWASKLLQLGSGQWDWTNFSIRIGGGEGDPITALDELPPAGVGDFRLAVFKSNSIYLVNTDPSQASAANWAVQKLVGGIGCVGRRAVAPSGNDLLFMARDGVRSVRRMGGAAGQYELSAPLSRPLQPYIDRINWQYANLIAAVTYKELTLFAVPLDAAVVPNTVLVWHGRLQRWIGIWTGWTPGAFEVTRFNAVLQLVLGESTGFVRQWKDTSDKTADATYLENGNPIASKLWTRAFLFGEPLNDKSAYHFEARFSSANALVNFTAVVDGADDTMDWSKDLTVQGVNLPVNLPFDLSSVGALLARRGLRSMKHFNEMYVRIESAGGWWELKNISLSAFVNMLANQ